LAVNLNPPKYMGLNEIEGITRDKISLSSKNSDVSS
jgi:hypothetical protein